MEVQKITGYIKFSKKYLFITIKEKHFLKIFI